MTGKLLWARILGYGLIAIGLLEVPERPWLSALVAIILFLVLSSASIVAGRLDTRFLGRDPAYSVPFRCPTMVSVFWTCIALLVLYSGTRPDRAAMTAETDDGPAATGSVAPFLGSCRLRQVRAALLVFYAVPFFACMFWYFMFWTARQQIAMAEDWADYFRATDALRAAFLLDVPDSCSGTSVSNATGVEMRMSMHYFNLTKHVVSRAKSSP